MLPLKTDQTKEKMASDVKSNSIRDLKIFQNPQNMVFNV